MLITGGVEEAFDLASDPNQLRPVPDAPWASTLRGDGERWLGDFATLWRARGGPGAKASAEWMAAQLAAAAPGASAAAAPTAGQAIERVKSFQRAQGLAADGVPGALTLMQLNRALGVDEPRLQR